MAKEFKIKKPEEAEVEAQESPAQEMTLEEASAYRASLHKPEVAERSEEQNKESFRIFWAEEKYKYGMQKDLGPVIWLHLKATKNDSPEKFNAGIENFGLKIIK